MRDVDYSHLHLLNEWVWGSLSAVSSSGAPTLSSKGDLDLLE